MVHSVAHEVGIQFINCSYVYVMYYNTILMGEHDLN